MVIFAQNWFSSSIRKGEVKHWKSKYNVRPSISFTYARVFRRMNFVNVFNHASGSDRGWCESKFY